jgi:hypothetical protein
MLLSSGSKITSSTSIKRGMPSASPALRASSTFAAAESFGGGNAIKAGLTECSNAHRAKPSEKEPWKFSMRTSYGETRPWHHFLSASLIPSPLNEDCATTFPCTRRGGNSLFPVTIEEEEVVGADGAGVGMPNCFKEPLMPDSQIRVHISPNTIVALHSTIFRGLMKATFTPSPSIRLRANVTLSK